MGRNLLAICLATIAFTLWGYIWYATVFDDVWQSLIGRSEGELIDMAVARGQWQNFFTVFISLVQALGIYIALRLTRAQTFLHHIGVSILLSTLIVLPALGNATLFAGTPVQLLILDYGHFLCGYAGMAFVIFLVAPFTKKASENSEA